MVIILSFLFVDMFDTLGTLIGVANKAQMLDENDKLPRIKQALLADAIATSAVQFLVRPQQQHLLRVLPVWQKVREQDLPL